MKIIVCGGDGFCGWPTSLHLASLGHEVLIVDNLSRRNIDHQLSSGSLTSISSISERVDAANEYFPGLLRFENIDIALEFERIAAVRTAVGAREDARKVVRRRRGRGHPAAVNVGRGRVCGGARGAV